MKSAKWQQKQLCDKGRDGRISMTAKGKANKSRIWPQIKTSGKKCLFFNTEGLADQREDYWKDVWPDEDNIVKHGVH